ncbi:polyprenyl synthetase family protein [Chitinibacter sp. SCUT-21]|uniref:polyprenyl synthetase family protein n=1 Tax=Chitinibacter sp. SCUT-21 TaxID=2970891 RepID=UPI0035A5AB3E
MQFVKSVVDADMAIMDNVIRDRLYSDVVLVRQVAEYIVASGGKRLRPMITLLSAQALGYQGTHHHELAAVIEFIHTATLLHDDVVDESSLRRGRDTANALFGNAASVLVGDFLYSRAFQMMVNCGSMRIMEVLSDATNVIAEGEVLQLMNIGNIDIDEADYLKVIRYKTAKLFEAASRLGAILAASNTDIEDAMARYGMHLGTAFQIIDDVLDYSGKQEEIGKSLGDDLAEGKPTLPLIYVMRHGAADAAATVKDALEHAKRENFDAVLAAVQQSGALEYARQVAQKEAQLAIDCLEHLADNPHTQALKALATLAINRNS